MVDGSLAKGFYAGTALERKRPGATTKIDNVEYIMNGIFILLIIICTLLCLTGVVK